MGVVGATVRCCIDASHDDLPAKHTTVVESLKVVTSIDQDGDSEIRVTHTVDESVVDDQSALTGGSSISKTWTTPLTQAPPLRTAAHAIPPPNGQ